MDRPVAESALPRPRDLARWLAPFPGRSEMTWRLTVICAFTALIASAYGTPEAALSVYIAFFLIRPDRVTSAILPAVMLLLVTVILGVILLVTTASIDYPVLRVSAMALLSAGFLFLASASKLRPVGAILAMIVGFGLDQMGRVPIGEASTRMLLYAWLMVAIPVGVAIVASLLLAPSPRRLACDRLACRLRLAAGRLRGDGAVAAAFQQALGDGNKQILTWLKLSVLEGSSTRADAAALRQAAISSIAIMGAADVLRDNAGPAVPDALIAPLAGALDDMAAMLEQGGYPVDIELALPTIALHPAMRAACDELSQAMTHFAVPAAAPAAAPPPRAGFFLPDAGSNPEHVAYALKTTAAAMFCYLLYTLLDWPGIHTCVITCYIVSLGTAGETVQKLRLRLAGCVIGALAGTAALVFIVPALDSVGGLLALVSVAAALSAWVAVGPPAIAYAGFQIAFAFFLCVIQGAGPGFDLTIARDRTIGILLGNVVVYLIFTRVWPVSIVPRVDRAVAALREQWRVVAAADATRHAVAAEALAAGREAERQLALAAFEPTWLRPSRAWREARQKALSTLSTAGLPVVVAAGRAPGDPALLARVEHAGQADPAVAPPAPLPQGDAALRALLALIDSRIAQASLSPSAAPIEEPPVHASP
ncbi:FUSC family protein [Achromobacter xylosoxidans]|uniref:FUSC family protein n=1 Tax=Alcaligenes xylosoxydans xylosoxydans TaxID=85698 RepID=UPI003D283BF8|nr:FUSC family protein [Achromobacter xylosoxidans]